MTENALRLPRWHQVLVEIYRNPNRPSYSQKLNRCLKASLTQIREIVKLLQANQLIEIKKEHKIKHLILTEKGKRVAASLQVVKFELNSLTQND